MREFYYKFRRTCTIYRPPCARCFPLLPRWWRCSEDGIECVPEIQRILSLWCQLNASLPASPSRRNILQIPFSISDLYLLTYTLFFKFENLCFVKMSSGYIYFVLVLYYVLVQLINYSTFDLPCTHYMYIQHVHVCVFICQVLGLFCWNILLIKVSPFTIQIHF